MIYILYGPGGSGKSLFQLEEFVVKQLRETERNVVTNLALNIPRLNEYLEQTFPDESIDVVGRIRLLSLSETKEFWKYRGPVKWTGHEYDAEIDQGVKGVCFIIDEAGAAGFSAQEWAAKTQASTRGVECCWYLDQQRKFGDDVVASTNGRTPSQIAKGFRDKAHVFIRMKNESLMQWKGFKGRDRLIADFFNSEPSASVEAYRRTVFRCDAAGLASCYWTERGVGVAGTGADKGKKPKGIPILWVIPLGIALASLCGIIPWALGKGAGAYIGGTAKAQIEAKAGPLTQGRGIPAPDTGKKVPQYAVVAGVRMEGSNVFVAVYGSGWYRMEGPCGPDAVLLSDGSICRSKDVVKGGGVSEVLTEKRREQGGGYAMSGSH